MTYLRGTQHELSKSTQCLTHGVCSGCSEDIAYPYPLWPSQIKDTHKRDIIEKAITAFGSLKLQPALNPAGG